MRPVPDRDGGIQMFVDCHRATRQAKAETALVGLPGPGSDGNRIVLLSDFEALYTLQVYTNTTFTGLSPGQL
jgi:hypothetical protein